jgi:hypothetical protein
MENGLEKSGKASTGDLVRANFNASKDFLWSAVQMNREFS